MSLDASLNIQYSKASLKKGPFQISSEALLVPFSLEGQKKKEYIFQSLPQSILSENKSPELSCFQLLFCVLYERGKVYISLCFSGL